MAYVKTVWETGDVITAEKLNNAEDQIEKLTPVVITQTINGNIATLGKTWQEIKDLYDAGQTLVVDGVPFYIGHVDVEEGTYIVGVFNPFIENGHIELTRYYLTDSASGYPAFG